MRVCYFGTYRARYPRNVIMIDGLRRNGVEVIECHESLWQGIEDRVEAASGGWLQFRFLARVIRSYARLLRRHMAIEDYDVMVLGYPGQTDVPLARLLTWLRRRPLVLDVFMSIYLIATERGLTDRSPLTGKVIRGIEKLALVLPDRLIQDTAEYVAWLERFYGLHSSRFSLVPTGADDSVYQPIEAKPDHECFRVLYYGTFIPNHGVETIVEAARLLGAYPDIQIEMIGDGPAKEEAIGLTRAYGLENVMFCDWMDRAALRSRIAGTDVCLGAFGSTPQSLMTIQNKIYEGLAMRKCVLTGESPAVRSVLTHGENVWLCERGSGESLARAILTLRESEELRDRLAVNGYRLFVSEFSPASLGRRCLEMLEGLRQ